VEVPCGATARLILIFLQGLLGMSVGGKTMQLVRDQVRRISTCRFTLQMRSGATVVIIELAWVQLNGIQPRRAPGPSSGVLPGSRRPEPTQ
jgi:heme A synthase